MINSKKDPASQNKTHAVDNQSHKTTIDNLRLKIIARGDLPHVSVARQLEIIQLLSEFPLGRFILERRGANGFWTDYMIARSDQEYASGLNAEGKPFNFMENFILNQSLVVLASRERYHLFRSIAQNFLKDNMVLASIPCGIMRDLITLDFSSTKNIHLVGIDIDSDSLNLAQNLAKENAIKNISFLEQDAWNLAQNESFDLITSSGLNVYEDDPQRVLELYSCFFNALKPGGILVTSVLTHPPGSSSATDWKLDNIPAETLLLDHIFHNDILEVKWRNFRSLSELDKEFKTVGFSEVSILLDKNNIFPTIIAKKS